GTGARVKSHPRHRGVNTARLFSKRKLRGARRDLPQIAIRIGEIPAIPAPRRTPRRPDDLAADAFGFRQYSFNAILGANDVGERDSMEAVAVGSHARVLGEGVPRVEGQRQKAAVQTEVDLVVILLLDRL